MLFDEYMFSDFMCVGWGVNFYIHKLSVEWHVQMNDDQNKRKQKWTCQWNLKSHNVIKWLTYFTPSGILISFRRFCEGMNAI